MKKLFTNLLPHEILFNLFLLITAGRLWWMTGFTGSSIVYTLLPIMLIIYAYVFRAKLKWRLVIYFVVMNLLFASLGYISPMINPGGKVDAMLQHWDEVLIGGNLSVWIAPYMSYWMTEILAVCYMLFMIQLPVACVYYLFQSPKTAKGFYVGMFSLYAVGYMGYLLVPAVGPYLAMADTFGGPIQAGPVMDFLHYMYPKGTNYTDVFPSLHCAVSTFILLFDCKHHKIRFWGYLLPCVGLWISTVYLRYHYTVDCIAGFILAISMFYFAEFYMKHLEEK